MKKCKRILGCVLYFLFFCLLILRDEMISDIRSSKMVEIIKVVLSVLTVNLKSQLKKKSSHAAWSQLPAALRKSCERPLSRMNASKHALAHFPTPDNNP